MNANELMPQLKELQDEVLKLVEKNLQLHSEIEALKAENQFFKDLMGDVEILRKV